MAEISNRNLQTGSLLSSTNRVEAPFVRVTINGYSFGLYESKTNSIGSNGMYTKVSARYPNYIDSLEIIKINGTINKYTLKIVYPIAQDDDPNFFEKLFGSVSDTREITLDYGDATLPNYIFRSEKCLITKLTSSVDIKSSTITYTLNGINSGALSLSNSYTFPSPNGGKPAKPSELIKQVVEDNATYHLLDVFTGMKNRDLDEFIDGSDKLVVLPTYTGISVLDYVANLVSNMQPVGSANDSIKQSKIYTLTTFEDTTDIYGGPYFKVIAVDGEASKLNNLVTYNIDIGYPSANIVTEFNISTDNTWSIYYDYNREISNSDYTYRIDNKGNVVEKYSPFLKGTKYTFSDTDKTWWSKVTEFPISAKIKLKGLLKPAILMTNIKLNVWFWGHKHISSGYYIITSQTDKIDKSGYFTTLELTRVYADDDLE